MRIYKNMRKHWQASSQLPLVDNLVLKIETMKRSSGTVVTTVTANRLERGFLIYTMGKDFALNVNSSVVRCTEKLVTELHLDALAKIESIKAQALNHYQGGMQ